MVSPIWLIFPSFAILMIFFMNKKTFSLSFKDILLIYSTIYSAFSNNSFMLDLPELSDSDIFEIIYSASSFFDSLL